MKSRLPWISSLLLLAAAVLAVAGGLHFSRREVTVRQPSDRIVLRAAASQVQRELQRLDALYEADVREITSQVNVDDLFATRALAGNLHGVMEVTRLTHQPQARPTRVRTDLSGKTLLPDVKWADQKMPAWGELNPVALLGHPLASGPENRPRHSVPETGWIRVDGRSTAFFWQRRPVAISASEVVVLTINPAAVKNAISAHLQRWLVKEFAPVAALKGFDFVETPNGSKLAGDREVPAGRTADFIAPLPGAWGDWQLASWDRLETKTEWQPAALAATAAVGSVLALTALLVFVQLRRAWRMAEERVSFVNRVSHELGTPLTNMLLNLDLARDAVEADPAASLARLDLVNEEGRRLARLVENVLVFSRQTRRAVDLKPVRCRPDDLAAAVLRQFEPALQRRNVVATRQGGIDEILLLDPDALAQILANLISNVEKYAAAGGILDLSTSWQGGKLIIEVKDAGPGIPATERERIFEPFTRLSSRVSEGSSGTGLGLSIARDLARQMGGDLRCMDCESGAHFQLEIPAEAEAATSPATSASPLPA